jgi:hypothetical protein
MEIIAKQSKMLLVPMAELGIKTEEIANTLDIKYEEVIYRKRRNKK